MKKAVFVIAFVAGFTTGFLWSFPAGTLLAGLLAQQGISYSYVRGNLFHIEAGELSKDNIKVERLTASFIPPFFEVKESGGIQIKGNILTKTATIRAENIKLENYQQEPVVSGNLSAVLELMLKGQYLVGSGKADMTVDKLKNIPVGSMNISAQIKPQENFSKVEAKIKGSMVNGVFTGKAQINVKNINASYLEGRFKGQVFGRQTEEPLKLTPEGLSGVRW
ncbi:hypothetical protein [Persephonella sp.]